MTEAWGMIIAALVALAGTFGGLIVGRRQVEDEAHIEHEQWLREQRQQAYGRFLTAWDAAFTAATNEVQALMAEAENLDRVNIDYVFEEGDWDRASHVIDEAFSPVKPKQEQVLLLGPDLLDGPATRMGEALERLEPAYIATVTGQPDRSEVTWEEAVQGMQDARQEMLDAMRQQLRSAPKVASKRRLFGWRRRALSG
ncbi:hypothetical protein ACPCDX_29105 [Streptomyces koyangensis]|uniref:hypothetical protein n=1 Tax=Streptomyces koyangensis TaxID=188770 RepID=UPI003C2BB82E